MGKAVIWNVIWSDLAQMGEVEKVGGQQYCRCYNDWIAAGCPVPVIPWIRQHTCPPIPPLNVSAEAPPL